MALNLRPQHVFTAMGVSRTTSRFIIAPFTRLFLFLWTHVRRFAALMHPVVAQPSPAAQTLSFTGRRRAFRERMRLTGGGSEWDDSFRAGSGKGKAAPPAGRLIPDARAIAANVSRERHIYAITMTKAGIPSRPGG